MITFIAIGVDPGKTTGVAAVMLDDRLGLLRKHTEVSVDELEDTLFEWLSHLPPTCERYIGYERFIITPATAKKSAQPDALHMTGVVQNVARKHDCVVVAQNASDTKRLVTNRLLKRIRWYDPSARHAMDGMRQALRLLIMHRHSAFTTLVLDGNI